PAARARRRAAAPRPVPPAHPRGRVGPGSRRRARPLLPAGAGLGGTAAGGVPARPGRARVERHPELADLDLVARLEHRALDAVAVDVRAVERADVTHDELVALAHELDVLAGDRHVV